MGKVIVIGSQKGGAVLKLLGKKCQDINTNAVRNQEGRFVYAPAFIKNGDFLPLLREM